jgi:uncharacterized damage-inducible protein DinB
MNRSATEAMRRRLAYDDWANRETLQVLRTAEAPPPPAVQRFAHLVSTITLWISRIDETRPPDPVWPEWELGTCESKLERAIERRDERLASWTEEDLSRTVEYVNSDGESWTSPLADILEHLLVHGAYHRGQIALDLRAAGIQPPLTDFIHAARTGVV